MGFLLERISNTYQIAELGCSCTMYTLIAPVRESASRCAVSEYDTHTCAMGAD